MGVETYTLAYPIETKEGLITELTLREPNARDMRALPILVEHQTWGQHFDLLATLTAQPTRIINELHGEDALALVNIVQKKLAPGQ